MPLVNKWFQGCKPEDKPKLEETVRNAKHTLDILVRILETELQELDADRSEDYEKPSWAYKQAHNNGHRKAITNFLRLLRLDK